MSCFTYINDNPYGGSVYVSGTTCFGNTLAYTLNYGDSVCMNNDYPIISCENPTVSGFCAPYSCCLTVDDITAFWISRLACRENGSVILLGGLFTSYNGHPVTGDTIAIDSCGGFIRQMPHNKQGDSLCANYFGAIGLYDNQKTIMCNRPSVEKYNADLTIDSSFNIGKMLPFATAGCAEAYDLDISTADGSVLIGSDGNAWITGYTNSAGTYTNLTGLLKLDVNGNYQSGFQNRLSASTRLTPIYEPNGDKWYIINAGSYDGITGNTGVVRVLNNGDIDPTFTFYNPSIYIPNGIFSIFTGARQSDGKLVLASDASPYVFRINTDGSLDTTFTATSPYLTNGVNAIKIQNDGKIICADSSNGRVYRLNTDGSTDATFNVGLTNGSEFDIAIDGAGNIWIGGQFNTYNGISAKKLVKLNPDGTTLVCIPPTPTMTTTPTRTPTLTPTITPTITQTNTATPSPTPCTCESYTIAATNFFGDFVWTDCNGVSQSIRLYNTESLEICACLGTVDIVEGTGSITDNGLCTITATPTPTLTSTPTITPTPSLLGGELYVYAKYRNAENILQFQINSGSVIEIGNIDSLTCQYFYTITGLTSGDIIEFTTISTCVLALDTPPSTCPNSGFACSQFYTWTGNDYVYITVDGSICC